MTEPGEEGDQRAGMAAGASGGKGRRWSWARFASALGLVALGGLAWWVGMETAVFRPSSRPEVPLAGWLCLVASPFITAAGGLWLLVMLARTAWPNRP